MGPAKQCALYGHAVWQSRILSEAGRSITSEGFYMDLSVLQCPIPGPRFALSTCWGSYSYQKVFWLWSFAAVHSFA